MNDPVQQGISARLFDEALERAGGDLSEVDGKHWIVSLLCSNSQGRLEMPEMKLNAQGLMEPVFSEALRARVGALLKCVRFINGQDTLSGISIHAAELERSGMFLPRWEDAVKAGIVNRSEDNGGAFYTISPELANQEFLPRARFIAGLPSNAIEASSILDRFGQPEHPAGRGGR